MVKRRFKVRLVTALGAILSLVCGGLALGSAALSASAAAPPAIVTIAPLSTSVKPGELVTVTAEVSNTSAKTISAASLRFATSSQTLSSIESLQNWLTVTSGDSLPGNSLGELAVPALEKGQSVTLSFTFASSALANIQQWGTRGIAAELVAGDLPRAQSRTSLLLAAGKAPGKAKISTLLPISAPATALGLTSRDELEAATGAQGYLTQLLNAGLTHSVTLAVDPKITTSIVAEGNAAPATARNWLQTLARSGREGMWLSYADSDLMGQLQAGAKTPVVPQTTDIANMPTPTPSPTASPSTPTTTTPPSWAGWSPNLTDVVWPLANTVSSQSNLDKLAELNYHRVILSSGNVATDTPTHAQVGQWNSAVVSDGASTCLARAQLAQTRLAIDAGVACAISYLASALTQADGDTHVVASFSRVMPAVTALSTPNELLTDLFAQQWLEPVSLSSVFASTSAEAELLPRAESKSRIASIRQVLTNQKKITAYAPVSSDPAVVINPGERRLASVLTGGWPDARDWQSGLATNAALTTEVLNSVSTVTSSSINMVGGQARIPIVVRNELDAPVTVVLNATPSNARLVVEGSVQITIEANSQNRAYVPVSARVGSGSVDLEITLTTTAGVPVGASQTIPVQVRADWEAWGLIGIGVIFIGLVIAGVIRTVRKRKEKPHG